MPTFLWTIYQPGIPGIGTSPTSQAYRGHTTTYQLARTIPQAPASRVSEVLTVKQVVVSNTRPCSFF